MNYPIFSYIWSKFNYNNGMRLNLFFVFVLSIFIGLSFTSCSEEDSLISLYSINNVQKKDQKPRRGRNHANIEYSKGEIKNGPSTGDSGYEIFVEIKDHQLVVEIKEKLEYANIIIKDKDGFIVYQENNITIGEKKVIVIDSANDFPYFLSITANDKEINGKIISYWVDEEDEE